MGSLHLYTADCDSVRASSSAETSAALAAPIRCKISSASRNSSSAVAVLPMARAHRPRPANTDRFRWHGPGRRAGWRVRSVVPGQGLLAVGQGRDGDRDRVIHRGGYDFGRQGPRQPGWRCTGRDSELPFQRPRPRGRPADEHPRTAVPEIASLGQRALADCSRRPAAPPVGAEAAAAKA